MAVDPFYLEVFVEWAIATCFILLRFFARLKTAGIRNFHLGDAFCFFALIFYTLETSGTWLLGQYGTNLGLDAETAPLVPESQIPSLVTGSKLAFVNWMWYICFIWCLKAVLLVLYYHMGAGVWQQQRVVIGVSIFAGAAWLASMLTHICGCVPVSRGWQINPYPGENCTVRPTNHWVIGCLNIATDILVILIPMPLLFKVRIALSRKIILMGLFGSGILVIVATILRTYYSLQSITQLLTALAWASREMFIATIVVCLPGIRPLFHNTEWLRSSSNRSNQTSGTFESTASAADRSWVKRPGKSGAITTYNDGRAYYEMPHWNKGTTLDGRSVGESEEAIIGDEEEAKNDHVMPTKVRSAYTVTRDAV